MWGSKKVMIALCENCRKRNRSKLPQCADSECHICRGASSRLGELAQKALELIPGDVKKFAISSEIPRDMMAREEDVWDYGLGVSIKSEFNHLIAGKIEKLSGLVYDFSRADGKLIFDFSRMEVRFERSDIFVFGRYKKYSPELAQSTWTCTSCSGKGCSECDFKGVRYNSIEDILSEAGKGLYRARDAELHSSGREDIDVLNTAGRPFILEIRKPLEAKCPLSLLAARVNANKGVEISDLRYVHNSEVALISDSHFDKAYEAEIEIKGFERRDLEAILSLKGAVLSQRTPQRVAHRRSDLVRKRRILDLRVISEAPPRLFILSEAGTYIKEFVNGDLGRTNPSITGATGKDAKCIKLLVAQIHDDFLDDVMSYV
ncbi:MAG: tRNA pseudouridine(54/55) synthase Pus10 [Candidatus ainarchaeum sp.]|nr:tRNA pseudouridine(54/55) synthase Pus10 [Candidatus ainarchaeum sp.]